MESEHADASSNQAGPSREGWHTVSMRIPFLNHQHATIAKRALEVDKEQHPGLIHRTIEVENEAVVVHYACATVRLLRLSTNSFFSSVDLVVRTLEAFAPDPDRPDPTDEELEEQRRLANSAQTKGIELRGDGKGAGSGEEVR
ncbi:transcription factor Pcc1-domain-containing protein [Kockovaella imperatae]|uniref:Transcription factor Pcc1-domain-containing protein n=1 Tax=Kockovaella imperatae TaxID=4999 RepID=A0A1Y1U7C4_9TREE|nr:transcription factor Pcc1-domain-containing protein [Kockovaella imperatae]ORX33930.1 transcription factor Pcc1-domain-containing protein [Kockovaella imperatae]